MHTFTHIYTHTSVCSCMHICTYAHLLTHMRLCQEGEFGCTLKVMRILFVGKQVRYFHAHIERYFHAHIEPGARAPSLLSFIVVVDVAVE